MNNSEKKPIRVTFFGDSIFVGQGISIYQGWVTQIARYLDEYGEKIGRQFLVTNASVNGRTTRQALEDMPYSIQSDGVDILVVQFGLNDCNYWVTDRGLPRVSLGAYKENLREIITRGMNFGAHRVLLNNNHPTSRTREFLPNTSITYEDSNRLYCQEIRALAAEFGEKVQFQDIYTYFNEQLIRLHTPIEKFLLIDELHLSIEGHTAYFNLMLPIILTAVNDFIATEGILGG